jgi:hypothetical protein
MEVARREMETESHLRIMAEKELVGRRCWPGATHGQRHVLAAGLAWSGDGLTRCGQKQPLAKTRRDRPTLTLAFPLSLPCNGLQARMRLDITRLERERAELADRAHSLQQVGGQDRGASTDGVEEAPECGTAQPIPRHEQSLEGCSRHSLLGADTAPPLLLPSAAPVHLTRQREAGPVQAGHELEPGGA